MDQYFAIAYSEHFADKQYKFLEAKSDAAAIQEAEKWRRDDLGFDWKIIVTQRIA